MHHGNLASSCRKYFGSWNKAMLAAGIVPNTQNLLRKRIRCTDGHLADSLSERILDDCLYKHGIQHERHKRYPEGKYTCDFYLPELNLWVEYFGLFGSKGIYNKVVGRKREMAKSYGLHLVEIFPTDIYGGDFELRFLSKLKV